MMNLDSENNVHTNKPLDELRDLILGLTPDELKVLQSWLKNKGKFTEEVSEILPKAVLLSIKKEDTLGAILLPVVEQAIFTSVQNNPKVLADALFPVMGAAIRKSISDTFREMIQSLNQTLENQFSVERIKWRIEALFSSKSFAEIVLLKGVKYHVKSVFLIHKETGLLIQDAYPDNAHLDEADMVSSMLTAVQDFVKDSFSDQLSSTDTLDTIKLNDFNVWLEDAPLAYLAVVIEGSPPESVRQIFKSNLESIHGKYAPVLANFEGDTDDGIGMKPFLKNCVVAQEFEEKEKNNTKTYIILALLAVLIGVWAFYSIQRNYRWNNFIETLKTQKSVVIIENGFESGKPYLVGMKDALQSEFGWIAAQNDIDSNEINYRWTNYLSLEPEFVYTRILHKIKPPSEVITRLKTDTFLISGKASSVWIEKTKNYLADTENTLHIDISQLTPSEKDSILWIQKQFENYQLKFTFGVSQVNTENKELLDQMRIQFEKFQRFEPNSILNITVTLDNEGSLRGNVNFAKKRFRSVENYLLKNGLNRNSIELTIDSNLTDMKPRNMIFTPIKK